MTGANNPEAQKTVEVPSTRHPDQRKKVELISTMRCFFVFFFLFRFLFFFKNTIIRLQVIGSRIYNFSLPDFRLYCIGKLLGKMC